MDLAPVDWSDLILENFVTQAWSMDVGPLRLQGWLRSLAYTSTVCWVYKQPYYLPKLVDTLQTHEAYGFRWYLWTSSLVHGGNRPAKVTEGAPPCNRGWYDNHWGIQPTKLEGNNQSSWRYARSVWKWVGYNKDGHTAIWGNYVQVFSRSASEFVMKPGAIWFCPFFGRIDVFETAFQVASCRKRNPRLNNLALPGVVRQQKRIDYSHIQHGDFP